MKNKIFTVMTIAWILVLTGCGTTVRPGQMGLKWRPLTYGLDKEPVKEGFYPHLFWNDVLVYSVQWQSFTEKVDALTKDDIHINVEAVVKVRLLPRELYQLQLEVGPDFYNTALKPEFLTTVRSILADYTMVEIPEKSPEIEAKILTDLRRRIEGKHLEVNNVAISHIDFPAGVLQAIETKQAKEQEKIQKVFELDISRQEAEIAQVKAKGEADALGIQAKGEAEAQKIRAGGQAEAQRIIDQTLTSRFLQFKAFDSPNAKIIFVPTDKEGLPIIITPEGK